ncbi:MULTISPECIES: hypothetical protein [Hyphomicrobiales]|jgi:hypothetical protein|uniref:hypothetical protein n=1 Tax=Methylobacterium sp. CCH7-A2 TaxID=1768789 RepID=UPI0008301D1C|nr:MULTISPECIES: hypothetical protein [Hyphomicrobiales]
MTNATKDNDLNSERIETLDRFGQKRSDRPSKSARQERTDAADGKLPAELTDHEVRLKLADLSGQVYLRGFHRNRAMLKPAEAVVVAAFIMALATSKEAISIYDDILEGDSATLGELLGALERSSAAVKTEIQQADRTHHENEAAAWNSTAAPVEPRQ